VNDAPELVAGPTTTTAEDTPVNFTATALTAAASDVDGDTLAVGAITAQPANGVATLNADGTITYTPNPNFNGVDSFNYTLVDGSTGSVVVTATVTISARCCVPLRSAARCCVSLRAAARRCVPLRAAARDVCGGCLCSAGGGGACGALARDWHACLLQELAAADAGPLATYPRRTC
jgi:hypothetical protein